MRSLKVVVLAVVIVGAAKPRLCRLTTLTSHRHALRGPIRQRLEI